jgi:hypothetical protein
MSQEVRERVDKCLDIALDNRRLEIELLWKRNTAFWLFVSVIAAAVGVTLQAHRNPLSATGPLLHRPARQGDLSRMFPASAPLIRGAVSARPRI